MSRRKVADKREILPDSRFQSPLASKFINCMMHKGKKSKAETIFYKSLSLVEEKSGQPGLNVFKQAVNNAKPSLEVKSRRVGGATYQVPVEVRAERGAALTYRWRYKGILLDLNGLTSQAAVRPQVVQWGTPMLPKSRRR